MLDLVRLRMVRAAISKYSTERLASRSWPSAASRAIPTSAIPYFRLLFAWLQGKLRVRRDQSAGFEAVGPVVGLGQCDRANPRAIHAEVVVAKTQPEDEGEDVVLSRERVGEEEDSRGVRERFRAERFENALDRPVSFGNPPAAFLLARGVQGE